jgi:hypothetical protein
MSASPGGPARTTAAVAPPRRGRHRAQRTGHLRAVRVERHFCDACGSHTRGKAGIHPSFQFIKAIRSTTRPPASAFA